MFLRLIGVDLNLVTYYGLLEPRQRISKRLKDFLRIVLFSAFVVDMLDWSMWEAIRMDLDFASPTCGLGWLRAISSCVLLQRPLIVSNFVWKGGRFVKIKRSF